MDPILQILLSWQFIFFGLAIAAVMYVIRLGVEYITSSLLKTGLAGSKLWNELLLPILPVVIGAISGFYLKLFPYPGFTPGADGYPITGDRVIFGLVAGLLSTLLYRIIKSLLYTKLVSLAQTLNPTSSVTPSPEQIVNEEIPPKGKL
jgi:hypothetical protein